MDGSNIFKHISDMFNSGLKLTLNDTSKKKFLILNLVNIYYIIFLIGCIFDDFYNMQFH